ncbi:MAG: hypothetical protein PHE83_16605 [Opitutaceae bacterium]|nr:hypothetical protein [Opitutaceae bacterium]
MNQLLPRDLPDTPVHLFEETGDERISAEITTALEQPTAANPKLFRRLAWRPGLFASFYDILGDLQSQAEAAVADPVLALNIVEARPELLPVFWGRITASLAATEQLVKLARARPDEFDAPDLGPKLLANDPLRHRRALADDKAAFAKLERDILAQASQRRLESPAWAMAWLGRAQVPLDHPLDPALTAILLLDEEYTYHAIRLLRDRQAEPIVWEGLEQGIRSPRWAYIALRTAVLSRDNARCEQILARHPAWIIEYLGESDANYAQDEAAFQSCRGAAPDHELIEDLDYWMHLRTLIKDLDQTQR